MVVPGFDIWRAVFYDMSYAWDNLGCLSLGEVPPLTSPGEFAHHLQEDRWMWTVLTQAGQEFDAILRVSPP